MLPIGDTTLKVVRFSTLYTTDPFGYLRPCSAYKRFARMQLTTYHPAPAAISAQFVKTRAPLTRLLLLLAHIRFIFPNFYSFSSS